MIHTLTYNSIAVEVQEGSSGFLVSNAQCDNDLLYLKAGHYKYLTSIPGEIGSWQILSRASELTEEQWKGIVDFKESLPYTDYENKRGTPHFADYMKPLFLPPNWNDPVGYEMKLDTATESGLSLLKSHNLEPDVLILIKDKQ